MNALTKITNENFKNFFQVKLTEDQKINLIANAKSNLDIIREQERFSDFEELDISEYSFEDLTIGTKQDWFQNHFSNYFNVNNEWKEIFFEESFNFSELESFILNQVKKIYIEIFEAERKAFLESLEEYQKQEFYLEDLYKDWENVDLSDEEASKFLQDQIQWTKDNIRQAKGEYLVNLCDEKIEEIKNKFSKLLPDLAIQYIDHQYSTHLIDGTNDEADAQVICVISDEIDLEEIEQKLKDTKINVRDVSEDYDADFEPSEGFQAFTAYSVVSL